jgi:acyl transferase domain-containing protein
LVRAWPDCHLRRASVNSFGFGGANAHAIIDAYANDVRRLHDDVGSCINRDARLFLITANDVDAGKACTRSLSSYLESCEVPNQEHDVFLSRLSYTLGERRSQHLYRFAVCASSVSQLSAYLSGTGLSFTKSCANPEMVYIFTGQGAQWFAMGRDLIKEYPVYRKAITTAEAYLKSLGASWSLHGTSLLPYKCL